MQPMGISTSMFLTGLRALSRSQADMARSMERLATGKKINRASDNPALFRTAEKLHQRRVQLSETVESAQRANAVIDTADGVMENMQSLVVELQGLVTQAANTDGLTDDERSGMQDQANSILDALTLMAGTATFDGQALFGGRVMITIAGSSIQIPALSVDGLGSVTIDPPPPPPEVPEEGDGSNEEIPAEDDESDEPMHYSLGDLRGSLSFLSGDMEIAQKVVDSAVEGLAEMRAYLGMYRKNTLGHQVDALSVELENTVAAESLITDTDFAEEVSTLARSQMLQTAAIATLQIAQQNADNVLSLMQPISPFVR